MSPQSKKDDEEGVGGRKAASSSFKSGWATGQVQAGRTKAESKVNGWVSSR